VAGHLLVVAAVLIVWRTADNTVCKHQTEPGLSRLGGLERGLG
jgi:hypothetical protein